MAIVEEEIIALLEAYFSRQSEFDGDGMLEAWHPGGVMYLVGNQNDFRVVTIEQQVAHIREVKERAPGLEVHFLIDEIERVEVHDDLIASVHIRYRMILPEGFGRHRCFYNLAKVAGKWGIVNAVDRGIQVIE